MRAVQSVAIEEHEVRFRRAVQCFVDAKQSLYRCPSAALGLRVQTANTDDPRCGIGVATGWRRLTRRSLRRLCLPSRLGGAASASESLTFATGGSLRFAGLLARRRRGFRRFCPTLAGRPARGPPSLDFRHAITDNLLQM